MTYHGERAKTIFQLSKKDEYGTEDLQEVQENYKKIMQEIFLV